MAGYRSMLFVFCLFFFFSGSVYAFQGAGCVGECVDCHTLSEREASVLLKTDRFGAEIVDIKMSPVKGLWEVTVSQGGRRFPIYIDFGKKYLVEGRFIALADLGKPISLRKIDLSKIPLDDALVMGNPDAEKKVIVFDDPDCPYCKKLHGELKKVLAKRKDIVFYIKLYPLSIHPDAYKKSKTILCKRSVELLEDAFAGKSLPEPDCPAKEVDENIKLAKELKIKGTPAIILPDGRLVPGYVNADILVGLIDNPPVEE